MTCLEKNQKTKKERKKKDHRLLRFCSCKCQNMISVTHFWYFVFGGKICLVRALLGTLESPMLRFTCYKQKAPLRYQQPSEHLQRCAHKIHNPTHKTETWTANSWGGVLLIANHLAQSVQYDEPIKNTEQQSGPIYYTLFFTGARCCYVSTSHSKVCNYMVWWAK